MLNPTNASKSPLSSRVALPVALMLAGVFGLGISILQPETFSKIVDHAAPAEPQNAEPVDADRLAKIEEPAAGAPKDLVEFCAQHVTEKRSFVVLKRGTCVVITEPCQDPVGEARKILSGCKDPDARFLTETSTEGDFIVAFKDPVFQRFSKKDLAKIQPWLRQSATALLTPTESVAAGEGWVPPENARVGLYARRLMLEDATNIVPVKIIRAKERVLASN